MTRAPHLAPFRKGYLRDSSRPHDVFRGPLYSPWQDRNLARGEALRILLLLPTCGPSRHLRGLWRWHVPRAINLQGVPTPQAEAFFPATTSGNFKSSPQPRRFLRDRHDLADRAATYLRHAA